MIHLLSLKFICFYATSMFILRLGFSKNKPAKTVKLIATSFCRYQKMTREYISIQALTKIGEKYFFAAVMKDCDKIGCEKLLRKGPCF
jgi:hypothetical protein